MKKNLFIITEDERDRILGMHIRATSSQYLSEEETPQTETKPEGQVLTFNDRDYAYKKEGENYFFKLQANPASPKAQEYKKAGKFLNWTAATGKGLDAIKKLDFKPETMATASVANTTVTPASSQTPTTPTTAQTAAPVKPLVNTGGGSQPTGQSVTTQTSPQVSADLKSASQIRQEFRQGKRDMRKLQRERDKLYNTYNRLSDKMDKATADSYINNIAELDKLLAQK